MSEMTKREWLIFAALMAYSVALGAATALADLSVAVLYGGGAAGLTFALLLAFREAPGERRKTRRG